MKISIMSRSMAVQAMQSNLHGEKTVIISITEPGLDIPDFKNKDLLAVYPMHFWDIEEPLGDWLPASREDVRGIREFIDRYRDAAQHILVHCAAGISRSSAAAAAISEYLGIKHQIFSIRRYRPNIHVYQLMCEEFGIVKTQKDYEALAKNRRKSLFEGQDREGNPLKSFPHDFPHFPPRKYEKCL